MSIRLTAFLFLIGSCTLAGCGPGKLNVEKKWTLDTGDAKGVDVPGISKPQTINVDFNSTESEVSVYVFKEEDAKGDDGLITSDPKKALGNKRGKADSFSVEVPENTPVRVIVRLSSKQTEVTLKVKN